MRISLVVLVLALAGLLAVDLEPSAAPRKAAATATRTVAKPAPQTVEVAFIRNGRLTRVERVVPKGVAKPLHALRELVQGPTRVERRQGIRTAIPEGVRPRSVRARGELWLASFSRSLRRSRRGEDEAGASRADRRDACTAGLAAVRSCRDGRSPGHDGPPGHASRCMARRDGGERLSIRGSRDSASTLDARVSRPEGRDRLAGLPDRAGASRFPGLGRPGSNGNRHRPDAGGALRRVAPEAVCAACRASGSRSTAIAECCS